MITEDLEHGGAIDAMREHFPDAPAPWVDLSTGINPFAYPLLRASTETFSALPRRDSVGRCRRAMARAWSAQEQYVLPAPGSELLIRLLPTILGLHSVAVLQPGYGDHAHSWRSAGCEVIEDRNPLRYACEADAVVLCHPNNPDGRRFPRDDLLDARERLAERAGWLIIDEAYADLYPEISLAGEAGKPGLVILRSFGKFYGLAGLRLGALLAPPPVLEAMTMRLGMWSVSGIALETGARAYADVEWQEDMRRRLARARKNLDAIFGGCGFEAVQGTDLFAFLRLNRAAALWRYLAERGIYVRRFPWSESCLRIGLPGTSEASERLRDALDSWRGSR